MGYSVRSKKRRSVYASVWVDRVLCIGNWVRVHRGFKNNICRPAGCADVQADPAVFCYPKVIGIFRWKDAGLAILRPFQQYFVISGRWLGDNVRPLAMKPHLLLEKGPRTLPARSVG